VLQFGGRATGKLCYAVCSDCVLGRLRRSWTSHALPSTANSKASADCLEYVIQVDRTQGDVLGLQVDTAPDGRLCVLGVKPGLVQLWNDMNPSTEVSPGDFLVSVNGQRRDASGLMEICRQQQPLELRFRREPAAAPALAEDTGRQREPASKGGLLSKPETQPLSPSSTELEDDPLTRVAEAPEKAAPRKPQMKSVRFNKGPEAAGQEDKAPRLAVPAFGDLSTEQGGSGGSSSSRPGRQTRPSPREPRKADSPSGP
ncbi:ADCK1, partial [Symbiodinium pilosum]